jgi:hypothetical protein
MTLKEPAADTSANLEYPACPLCDSDRRELRFRLREAYNGARCIEYGLHWLVAVGGRRRVVTCGECKDQHGQMESTNGTPAPSIT